MDRLGQDEKKKKKPFGHFKNAFAKKIGRPVFDKLTFRTLKRGRFKKIKNVKEGPGAVV